MTRGERREARRTLAGWFRDNALVPDGAAWRAAADDGVRDVDTLRGLNAADGLAARRLPDGSRLPGGVRDGDLLPDVHPGGIVVVGSPVTDPADGRVWVTGRTVTGELTDVALPPAEPVTVHRHRTAPEWVAAAAADYRAARDAWAAVRESGTVVPAGAVAGAAGANVTAMQLSDDEYRQVYPQPRFADYLKEHAAMMRDPDA